MSLFTFHAGQRSPPSLVEAAALLGTTEAALDPSFGVVLLDERDGKYCVLAVDDSAIVADSTRGIEGPWADQRVERL